jgi:threonine dehydratase
MSFTGCVLAGRAAIRRRPVFATCSIRTSSVMPAFTTATTSTSTRTLAIDPQHISKLSYHSTTAISQSTEDAYPLNEDGDVPTTATTPPIQSSSTARMNDDKILAYISPSDPAFISAETMLNAKDHVVGYLSHILNARVYDAAIETDLQPAKNLSTHLKNHVLLKREDLQPVFSFKIRGAYNKMVHLTPEELAKGVVACSAGNHAQGVALSARMLSCRAIIVMPLATPAIKVKAVRMHGGPFVEVRLFGNNYDEAATEANRLKTEEGMTFVHPFDDPLVIAGQGTIGVEILKKCVGRPLDAIFVCCGGGGMLAGIASYVKRVRPSVKVIGVEAEDAAGMTSSLQQGKLVTLPTVGLFADGAAVRTVGTETFRICKELVDDMVTVSTDEICDALKLAYNDARVVLEPAGALGIAGMKKYVHQHEITGQTMVAITSGECRSTMYHCSTTWRRQRQPLEANLCPPQLLFRCQYGF